MTSNEVKVVTADLKALAGAMRAVFWYQPDAQATPPDQLPLAVTATANLNDNAAELQQYQKLAEAQGHRLGEMLDSAAKAYDEVDEKYKTTLDDPQRHAMVEGITLAPPTTPLPPVPDAPPAPKTPDASGYSNIEQTHAQLLSGSDASLRAAAVQWGLAADSAEGARPPKNTKDWEGEAADAAHQRLDEYGDWCTELGAAWRRLAEAATKIADAHVTAVTEHTPLYLRYLAAKEALARLLAEGDARSQVQAQHVQAEMAKLQQASDEVRQNYAGQATFDQVKVEKPGFASSGGTGGGTTSGSGGGGGSPSGGGQPLGAPQAPSAPMSPQGADPLSAGQTPSGSSGSGGNPTGSGGSPAGKGGGSPAGGGSPSGGGGLPGGGLPDGGLPDPGLDDPGVSPAGAGGGSGGGGAAGGGGAPGMPLQPSVGAETVGPAPGGARGGGSGAIPASAMGGGMAGMGGGMGGMGHGGGAQQGKEKRRDPNLAPDEDLYTEDRPWTEGVIGARRRRDTPDKDQK
jgi:hypothetical protein